MEVIGVAVQNSPDSGDELACFLPFCAMGIFADLDIILTYQFICIGVVVFIPKPAPRLVDCHDRARGIQQCYMRGKRIDNGDAFGGLSAFQ